MLEGTYLWDAKHGVPANPNDLDNPSESVEAFINELREKPQEANANLHGFAQFFSEFLKEAKEHFPDDRAVTQNQSIADFAKDESIDAVLLLDEMPSDSFDYFASMLTHGANLYNLVYTDSMSHLVREPTDPAETEINLTEWQQYLEKLKQAPDTEQEALPETKAKAKKLVATLLKERLNKLGIKKFKVNYSDQPTATININNIKIELTNIVEFKKEDLEGEKIIRIYTRPIIYILIEGISREFSLTYFHFKKIPFDRKIIENKFLESQGINELKANLEKGLEMLMYIYPHIHSIEALYQFLLTAKNDKYLGRHYFSGLRHINQATLYELSVKTNQSNLSELRDKLKAEYIDDQLFALREEEKHWEAEEDRLEKEDSSYKRYPFRKPENPEAEYAKEFDDYVAGIGEG